MLAACQSLWPRMHTNEHESERELDAIAESVIGAAYEVSNVLGARFLEKIYERALARELALRRLRVLRQVSFPVSYKGQLVDEYLADLVVECRLVIELKCVERFSNEHMAQCINYLKASDMRLALLSIFRSRRSSGSELCMSEIQPEPRIAKRPHRLIVPQCHGRDMKERQTTIKRNVRLI